MHEIDDDCADQGSYRVNVIGNYHGDHDAGGNGGWMLRYPVMMTIGTNQFGPVAAIAHTPS